MEGGSLNGEGAEANGGAISAELVRNFTVNRSVFLSNTVLGEYICA